MEARFRTTFTEAKVKITEHDNLDDETNFGLFRFFLWDKLILLLARMVRTACSLSREKIVNFFSQSRLQPELKLPTLSF